MSLMKTRIMLVRLVTNVSDLSAFAVHIVGKTWLHTKNDMHSQRVV